MTYTCHQDPSCLQVSLKTTAERKCWVAFHFRVHLPPPVCPPFTAMGSKLGLKGVPNMVLGSRTSDEGTREALGTWDSTLGACGMQGFHCQAGWGSGARAWPPGAWTVRLQLGGCDSRQRTLLRHNPGWVGEAASALGARGGLCTTFRTRCSWIVSRYQPSTGVAEGFLQN